MDSEEELAKKIADYQKLGKENPNVDVNLLMMSALDSETKGKIQTKSRRWPYLISLGLPPFGLIYAFKYYFSGDEDDKQAAKICLLLTVISVILFFATAKLFFARTGTSLQQIEQIKPSDIYQAGQ